MSLKNQCTGNCLYRRLLLFAVLLMAVLLPLSCDLVAVANPFSLDPEDSLVGGPKSTWAQLESLEFEDGSLNPSFDPETYRYELLLPEGTDAVKLPTCSPGHEDAQLSFDREGPLRLEDVVRITVTAEDGKTTSDYTVTVTRDYKIGGGGPAGGVIFYEDAAGDHDWTYLEAAPQSTEWENTEWGDWGTKIGGDAGLTGIGDGRAATDAIVDHLDKDTTETDRAAQLCNALEHEGYTDWFLPSRDELNAMYENLHEEGVGGFAADYYWSSSEEDKNTAWLRDLGGGTELSTNKTESSRVRAVRAF